MNAGRPTLNWIIFETFLKRFLNFFLQKNYKKTIYVNVSRAISDGCIHVNDSLIKIG